VSQREVNKVLYLGPVPSLVILKSDRGRVRKTVEGWGGGTLHDISEVIAETSSGSSNTAATLLVTVSKMAEK
jgi:uncharacterized membrane protein YadS